MFILHPWLRRCGRPKVAIRPTIPRPCVPTYIIADSYVGPWAAPSDLSTYPKNSRVLEIGRYQMLKILFWGMVGLKSLLDQLYLDLASPPILLQILTWDHGPHLAILRLTTKIRKFGRYPERYLSLFIFSSFSYSYSLFLTNILLSIYHRLSLFSGPVQIFFSPLLEPSVSPCFSYFSPIVQNVL